MCDCASKYEQPVVVPIKKIISEAKDFRTFVLEYPLEAKPGQFIMAWMPGLDSKPFAVSHLGKNEFHFAVMAVGPFTKKMMELKKGDKIGFFGPYGTSFNLTGKRVVMVAGGAGTPPLRFAAEEAKKKGIIVDFIMGARTADSIAYEKDFKKLSINTFFCTNDGTKGTKGYTTDVLKELLSKKHYDYIYTCGPELMMKAVIDLSDKFKVPCQISMERYMKCGFGICGQCAVDGLGIPICKKGPVLDKEVARQITEFGKYKRDATGAKVYFGSNPKH